MVLFSYSANRLAAWLLPLSWVLLVLCSPTHAGWACGERNFFLLQAGGRCTDPATGLKYFAGQNVTKPCGTMTCTWQPLIPSYLYWACSYSAASVICRSATGPCDQPENCLGQQGQSMNCPSDSLMPAGTTCRSATLPCDVPEVCTGSSAACPADSVRPAGAVCRPKAPGTLCDVAEMCNGIGKTCPDDGFEPSSTVCREAVQGPPGGSSCDVEETCTGTSADCPPDTVVSSGSVCRPKAPGTLCDVAETCDGVEAACPDDGFEPSSTVCREAVQGPSGGSSCDIEETCTGTSADCPPDLVDIDCFGVNGIVCGGTVCRSDDVCQDGECICPSGFITGAGEGPSPPTSPTITPTDLGPFTEPVTPCIAKCGSSFSLDPACPGTCSASSCDHLNIAPTYPPTTSIPEIPAITNNPACNPTTGMCECRDAMGSAIDCGGVGFEGLPHNSLLLPTTEYAGLKWMMTGALNMTLLCEQVPQFCVPVGVVSSENVGTMAIFGTGALYRSSGTFGLGFLHATALSGTAKFAMVGRVCTADAVSFADSFQQGVYPNGTLGAIDGCVAKYSVTIGIVSTARRFVQLGWTGINRVDYRNVEGVNLVALDNVGIQLDD